MDSPGRDKNEGLLHKGDQPLSWAVKVMEDCFRGEMGEGWWEQRQKKEHYFKGMGILNLTL